MSNLLLQALMAARFRSLKLILREVMLSVDKMAREKAYLFQASLGELKSTEWTKALTESLNIISGDVSFFTYLPLTK